MKAFVSDLILYNCPLPHWYGNFAAAVYSLANRIYGGRSIDTALILDDIRMIRSDGDLPEAMQSIPDGESGDYSIASYPARDLARLLLEVDASTWDDGVDGCCGFTTFSPTDPSASRQTSSITDFLMALASYSYSNVDVPLVPLLQITTLVDRSLQDVSSCDTGTESLTDAMLTATLCAYYSSFDHRFQAIYFPDVRAKYESQDCAQFFDLSSFIAVKMSDDTELTIDAFWNAVNGSAEKKNIWSTFVETFDTDRVSFDQSIMMTRLIGTPKRAEKRRMVLRVNQYMTLGIEHDADDKQAMSFGEVVDESWRKSLRMYVDSVINDTSMLPFQLQRTSIPTPSAEMQILVMESIGGVYPQPASLETVVSTCIMYLSRESKANDGDEEYQGFLYGTLCLRFDQHKHRLFPTAGSCRRYNGTRLFSQPIGQTLNVIIRQERTVARRHHHIGRFNNFQSCSNAGQRPGEIPIFIGYHRIAEIFVDIFVAVGTDREGLALRLKNINHVFNQRRVFETHQSLIRTSHTGAFSSGKHQTCDFFLTDTLFFHRSSSSSESKNHHPQTNMSASQVHHPLVSGVLH